MSRIPFLSSPEIGIRRYFHYDESTDTFYIETEQQMDGILEANKQAFNDAPQRHGDLTRVASIPLSVLYDLKRRGIADDPVAMKKWLEDPDNRLFRTRPGDI